MTSRPRPSSPPPPPQLEDDDLLPEILLRLPPMPSSLPRASAVCKRWLSLVSDRRFVRRFRLHHRHNPPLLGFFYHSNFLPIMDPPNRVPEGRISLERDEYDGYRMSVTLGCRHGLVLIFQETSSRMVLVWDSVNRSKLRIAVPPWFQATDNYFSGAVLRTAGDIQHFQVVLVGTETSQQQETQAIAQVYSSETGVWGNLISTQVPPKAAGELPTMLLDVLPSVLVGNSLYWLIPHSTAGILEFDLDRQILLPVIPVPVDIYADTSCQFSVMQADGGGLGFFFMSKPDFIAQLWKRKTDCNGITSWVLERTIEMDKLLSLNSAMERSTLMILGYAEYNNIVVLQTAIGLFTVHLETLQFKKLPEIDDFYQYHMFESVYTAGMGIDDENDGAELLQNA